MWKPFSTNPFISKKWGLFYKVHKFTNKNIYIWYRDYCPKFATGLKCLTRHRSKNIWVTRLFFCQNDSLMGESLWQKDSLVTLILFELGLFWYLAHPQILGNSLYVIYSVLELRVLIFIDHAKLWGNYGVISMCRKSDYSQHMLLSYVSIMLEKLCLAGGMYCNISKPIYVIAEKRSFV